MTLRLLPEAGQEIDDAFAYYEAQRVGLDGQFIAALESGYDLIEAYPRAWPRVMRNARWYILKNFPYGTVYLIQLHEIVVVAVSHTSRRRGYWAHRLR